MKGCTEENSVFVDSFLYDDEAMEVFLSLLWRARRSLSLSLARARALRVCVSAPPLLLFSPLFLLWCDVAM